MSNAFVNVLFIWFFLFFRNELTDVLRDAVHHEVGTFGYLWCPGNIPVLVLCI